MVQDRLNKAVLRRLKELGLPSSLIDFGDFRERFFLHGWVMFVRDHDHVADVHLFQPKQDLKSANRLGAGIRRTRKNR